MNIKRKANEFEKAKSMLNGLTVTWCRLDGLK